MNRVSWPDHELIKRVYVAQKDDPLPGDFFQLVQGDLQLMEGDLSDQYLQQSSRNSLKCEIKQKTKMLLLDT